uniref:DUF1308 domain-containing protein n=1 Tax=Elaeophora elaphi TaxID=1147741 RepID=A0A0R3RGX4_9BILA
MLAKSDDTDDPEQIWKNKIRDVQMLYIQADVFFGETEGIGKYKRKLEKERKFLINLKNLPVNEMKKFLNTSNITYLHGLLSVAMRRSCCAFYKSFAASERKSKLEVELVVDDGATWVKVVSRNVRGLTMDFIGANGNANRSVIDQAHDYIEIARAHPHFFKMPKIIFEFVHGVPDLLRHKLESFGIEVFGDVVNINELVKLPADFALYDSDNVHNSVAFPLEGKCSKAEDCVIDTINLDISSVFALVSSLTHGNGANYNYTSHLLNAQAALERKRPVLPLLLCTIRDKKLIICRTAYDAVQSILRTVAGPQEKIRAEKLFEKVEIVEDKLSERAARLELSDRINQRSKIIFGSGDYYKAITVTANRHFVRAAAHQVSFSFLKKFYCIHALQRCLIDIHFAVFVHDSRALSEQKQLDLRA